ncbi:MAG: hypothetical protein ACTSRK_12420 [Promethearchaeota archaeon]
MSTNIPKNLYFNFIFLLSVILFSNIAIPPEMPQSSASNSVDFNNLSLRYYSPQVYFCMINGSFFLQPPQTEVIFTLNFTQSEAEIFCSLTMDILGISSDDLLYSKTNLYHFNPITCVVSYLNGTEVGIMPFFLAKDKWEENDPIIISSYQNMSSIGFYEGFENCYLDSGTEEDRLYDAYAVGYNYIRKYYIGTNLQESSGYSKFYFADEQSFLLDCGFILLYTEFIKAEFGLFMISSYSAMKSERFSLNPINYPLSYWSASPLLLFYFNYEDYIIIGGIGLLLAGIIIISKIISRRKRKKYKCNF